MFVFSWHHIKHVSTLEHHFLTSMDSLRKCINIFFIFQTHIHFVGLIRGKWMWK